MVRRGELHSPFFNHSPFFIPFTIVKNYPFKLGANASVTRMSNAMALTIGKCTCIMGGRMPFAPTIMGYPNKIGFIGKIYPEHLVLNQDLQDL